MTGRFKVSHCLWLCQFIGEDNILILMWRCHLLHNDSDVFAFQNTAATIWQSGVRRIWGWVFVYISNSNTVKGTTGWFVSLLVLDIFFSAFYWPPKLCYDINSYIILQHILFNSSPFYCRIYASVNRVRIVSHNGLSPIRCQAIIYTNAGLLSNGSLGTNFSKNLIEIQNFSFTKMHQKLSSPNWRPFCSGED